MTLDFYVSIRDPLYGFIELTNDEIKIINSSIMQRLRRIKQLSHTYLVYPSAVHTRFEHSLGTLYVADRMCRTLKISGKERKEVRYAALLHDISHGPFSHLFEVVLQRLNKDPKFSYEKILGEMINRSEEICEVLDENLESVIAILEKRAGLLSEIISSSVDADKMDYLRRDSYHTGVAYGIFDFERVVRNLSKTEDGEHLVILEKAQEAIESYRLGRYLLHAQVYGHHARLIADSMFIRAVELAIKEGAIRERDLRVGTNDFWDFYLKLDDYYICNIILENSNAKAAKLIKKLLDRKLFKRAFEVVISKDEIPNAIRRMEIMKMEQEQIDEAESEISQDSGVDKDFIIVYLHRVPIKLYESIEESVIDKREAPILVKKPNGSIVSLDEVSPISASKVPMKLYVFCEEDNVEKVKRSAEKYFGVKSRR